MVDALEDNNNDTKLTDMINNDVEWTIEHENILIEWADKAMCYRWLHSKANSMYAHLNAWYTIPVIIISTLTGTANFAQERVPINYQNYFVMIVGGFNILAGIITTIQQFLKVTQLSEAHRVSSIAWDKFYRNVKIELAKHPSERMPVSQMIKLSKEEFDRLMETSPVIPDKTIKAFKDAFKNSGDFSKIVKPEICDVLVSTDMYRNPWFNDENKEKKMKEMVALQVSKDNKLKIFNETNTNIVKDFKKTFFDLNNREPLDSEIVDNLKDKIELSILTKIIDSLREPLNMVIPEDSGDNDENV
uniref:SMODS and SLOG-associating 2TM effector domain-containing protein n=1 Tax=viral metagenome TaxID=1070528 RepID=A0A6C0HX30_9ZZZZ